MWTSANWVDAMGVATGVPTAASDVTFSSSIGSPANQNTVLGADTTINSLTIKDTVPVTISGNTLTIAGGGISVSPGAGLFTINSNLVLAGAQSIIVFNTAGAVINGAVSGSNGLTVAGTGQLTLGGANTYTGSTTILGGVTLLANVPGALPAPAADGGAGTARTAVVMDQTDVGGSTLVLGASQAIASLTGANSSKVNLNANSLTIGSILPMVTTAFDGVISGTGSLIKDGTSTQILGGINTYTGATMVNGGVLEVNGSIASATTTVAALGTLQGRGTIGGHLVNNGTVSPGSISGGPGTLTVTGNYTQGATGNVRIGIASASIFGKLVVNGTASLNGTITAFSVGGFVPQVNTTARVLTATTRTGTFSNVVNQISPLVKAQAIYDPTGVTLQFVQGAIPIRPPNGGGGGGANPGPGGLGGLGGLNGNGLAVAIAINNALNDSRLAPVLKLLDRLPLGSLPAALDRISPEELAALTTASIALSDTQVQNIQSHLESIISGSGGGFNAQGMHLAGSGPNYSGSFTGSGFEGPNGHDGKESKESKEVSPPYYPRLGTFITGAGEWINVGNTDTARGYDLVTGGFTLGVDYKFTDHLAIGIDAGYAHTGIDLENGGHSSIDAGNIGLYGTYFTGGFYADAAVTGFYSGYDNRRGALQGDAYGQTHGGAIDALFATGYNWHVGGLTLGPTGSFHYNYAQVKDYSEHGSLAPMSFPTQGTDSIRSAFGAKATYDWHAGGVLIRPELSLAWQHEYGSPNPGVITQFASGAGNQFTVFGPDYGRDSLLVGAGLAVIWNNRFSTYVYYDGEFARTNFDRSSITGGLRLTF